MTRRWEVHLWGKWGGSRTLTIAARSETEARRKVRPLMFVHETIGAVYRLPDPKLPGRAHTIDSEGRTRDPYTGEEIEL